MIKALEKLWRVDYHPGYHGEPTLLMTAAEIEREISERYIESPVDVDGVAWKTSDTSFYDEDGTCHSLDYLRYSRLTKSWQLGAGLTLFQAHECRHAMPRTVEDVLMDVLRDSTHPDMGNCDIIEKYATELRMAGDAE